MTTTPINKIKSNPNNPRVIKDDKFKKLVQSLKDLPEMAQVRPIVVNQDMIVLGGNMRLKAMKEAGWKEAPVAIVDWDEEKQRQFIIKDNVSFGEWDWDVLANEWDVSKLNNWALDTWKDELDYKPTLEPLTNYSDVTKAEIESQAKKLAMQMIKEQMVKDVICPSCGHEFAIEQ